MGRGKGGKKQGLILLPFPPRPLPNCATVGPPGREGARRQLSLQVCNLAGIGCLFSHSLLPSRRLFRDEKRQAGASSSTAAMDAWAPVQHGQLRTSLWEDEPAVDEAWLAPADSLPTW